MTPHYKTASTGTGILVNHAMATQQMELRGAVNDIGLDAYLEYVCEFANVWHSYFDYQDYSTPETTEPMFRSTNNTLHDDLINDNITHDEITENAFGDENLVPPASFWKLRYLFMPICIHRRGLGHAALVVISPEAKTIEYYCSDGKTGLNEKNGGSNCIERIIRWLAHYLGDRPGERFLPHEWQLRTPTGQLQRFPGSTRQQCGLYVISHAMCLAFGYGTSIYGPNTNERIREMMKNRASRMAVDLIAGGFQKYRKNEDNSQYYPLIDAPAERPIDPFSRGWRALDNSILALCAPRTRYMNRKYANCPGMRALSKHCSRNWHFYPKWSLMWRKGFAALLDYVLLMDEQRHTGEFNPRTTRPWKGPVCGPNKLWRELKKAHRQTG
ncbi:hypothetical protein EG329_001875 [Mollisiaceae sp. DMI_Dod_QoI]|nr:hypothetical protein EG329_001875 [Helotiales sp. DMI_Dod_QoI]